MEGSTLGVLKQFVLRTRQVAVLAVLASVVSTVGVVEAAAAAPARGVESGEEREGSPVAPQSEPTRESAGESDASNELSGTVPSHDLLKPLEPQQSEGSAQQAGSISLLSITQPQLTVVSDGTAVFDANNDPGNDSGPNNGIVRTNDTVQYRLEFDYDGPTTEPYATSTLPAGMEWLAAPPQCTGTGTAPNPTGIYDSITGAPGGDRRVLVCQKPTATEPGTESISPVAKVTTESINGEVKTVSFELGDADGNPVVASNEVSITVSAGAYYDLRKNSTGFFATRGPSGEPGLVNQFTFGITVIHPTRTGDQALKGMTQLASPITFTDDVSGVSANARLMNWNTPEVSTGTGAPGCAPVGNNNAVPASRIGISGSTADNAVVDTGTITCAPGAPGGTFSITLTGTDTRGLSFPTRAGTTALPAGTFYVATGVAYVWLPVQDVVDAGGQKALKNTYTDFDPDDVAGNSNFGDGMEPLANNSHTRTVTAGAESAVKYYRDFETGGAPGESSGLWQGDIRATAGFVVRSNVQYTKSIVEGENVILCDVFDHTSQRLVDRTAAIGPASTRTDGLTAGDFVLEFGAPSTYPSTYAEMRSTTCEDSDAFWTTDPKDAALGGQISPDGYRDSIDRVRIRYLVPVPPNASQHLNTYLRVVGPSTLDAANNPDGTLISNFARFRSGSTPRWITNTYNPMNHTGSAGDRIRLVNGEVRVNKSVLEQNPGSGNQVAPGTDTKFRLQPSVTTAGGGTPGDPMRDVIITDTLPATSPRLTVNPLSVTSPDGAAIEFCDACDGSDWTSAPPSEAHGVRWKFGDVVPGTVLQALDFSARVPLDATNGMQYTNTAVATSPDDPSSLALRSASATAQVIAGATVYATKSTATPYRPLAGPLVWDLTVKNATSSPMERLDAIDVLPFNGDDRQPASSFSGGFSGVSVEDLPATVRAYVTTTSSEVLDSQDGALDGFADPGSPGDAWFVEPGTGAWACTVDQLGAAGCPAASAVTAIRFASPSNAGATVLEAGETLTWKLALVPSRDKSGDTYTNRFRMRVNPEVLSRAVSTPDAAIRVQSPQVAVSKQTCTAADTELCDPADDAVWAETHTVRHGGTGVFRIQATNTGPNSGSVTVTDALPTGLEYVADSAVATAGDVSEFTPVWSVGELSPQQTETLTFQAIIAKPGEQVNTASARIVDEFDQSDSDEDSSALVAADTDVAIKKDVTSTDINSSGVGTITYQLEVANEGQFDETYTLEDTLAFKQGLEATAVSVQNVSPGDLVTEASWNGVDEAAVIRDVTIGAGDTHRFEVTVEVAVRGGLASDVTECAVGGGLRNVGTLLVDDYRLTDTGCEDAPASRVEVEKTGPATVAPDGELTWKIRVSNTGELDVEGLAARDALPEGVEFKSATGKPEVSDGVVVWQIDRLKAGDSVEYAVTARVVADAGEKITNCVVSVPPAEWSAPVAEAADAASSAELAPGEDRSCASTEVKEDGGVPGVVGRLVQTGAAGFGVLTLAGALLVAGIVLVQRKRASRSAQ